MFQHKKHLFFDLDHTLWDFDRNSAVAFDVIFKERGFDFNTDDFLKLYIPRNQYYWKLYQVNQISHEDLRYYRLKDVFDALHVEVSRETVNELSEEYITHLPNSNHCIPNVFYNLHNSINFHTHIKYLIFANY